MSNLALCEPILFVGKFNRNSRASDFYEFTVKQQDDVGEHKCPKILALWAELLECYCDKLAYDPFSGSGTTIIAAEQLGRKCFSIEIEPLYIDVAVRRWQNFTGKKAILERGGKRTKLRMPKVDE